MATINGKIGIGTRTVMGWSRAKCARVYRAAAAELARLGKWSAEDQAWFRDSHTFTPDGGQSQLTQTLAMFEDDGLTEAQAWTTFILWRLQTEATEKIHIPASEETLMWDQGASGETIFDERKAEPVLRRVLAA